MERSRILARLPPILADLVRQLVDDGIDVHPAAATTHAELAEEALRGGVNAVVVAASEINQYRALSADLGRIVLVVLYDRGRTGARYVDGRLEVTAGDLSAAALRALLRAPGH